MNGEQFRGIGTGLMKLFVKEDETRNAFVAMNEALKQLCEA